MSDEHILERNWLQHHRGQPVSVIFANGSTLDGVLRGYDHQSLELDDDGTPLLIYLTAVAYVRPHAAPAAG
jgi:sRNA-binding regulator protein Hfq